MIRFRSTPDRSSTVARRSLALRVNSARFKHEQVLSTNAVILTWNGGDRAAAVTVREKLLDRLGCHVKRDRKRCL